MSFASVKTDDPKWDSGWCPLYFLVHFLEICSQSETKESGFFGTLSLASTGDVELKIVLHRMYRSLGLKETKTLKVFI